MLLLVLAVALSLGFSFLCSISEATLLSVGRARVEQLARTGGGLGLLLRRFREQPDRPIAAILIVNTIANSGGAAIATDLFVQQFPEISPAWFAAFFVVTVLAATEIVPKTVGVVHADALALPVTAIVRVMIVGVWPLLFVTRALARMFARADAGPNTSLDEIRMLATAGMSQGVFGSITGELIHNVTRLRDMTAHDAMVPRDRVAFVSGAQSTEANLKRVARTGHSRFPYTPTGEFDDVQGIILTKELLFSLREREEPDWQALLVPLLVVPETATLNHVLRRFQHSRRHMAIVVDEYGSTQGIITLEDVLEEIVGEIEDELDVEESEFVERPDGTVLCPGIADVEKVFERFAIHGVETESKSLSGFLAERLQQVPAAGASVDVGGYRFEVTKANNRRAERVRVHRIPSEFP